MMMPNGMDFQTSLFLNSDSGGGQGDSAGITIVKGGTREIKVVRRVLGVNEEMAEANRKLFSAHGVFVLNMMSK